MTSHTAVTLPWDFPQITAIEPELIKINRDQTGQNKIES